MSTEGKDAPRESAPERQRWLIGIGISVAFGLFGAVMALLNYSHRSKPDGAHAAAAAAVAPAAAEPASHGNSKQKKGRDRP